MAMRLLTLLKCGAAAAAVASTLAPAGDARAQYVNGFYISGGLGLNILQDLDISRNPAAGGGSGEAVMDPGFAGLVAIGWGFGNGIRAEIEGNYRVNDVDRFGGFGGVVNGARSDGTVSQYGVMLIWRDAERLVGQ